MLAFRRQFAEQQRDLFFARLAGACAPAVDK
jgi:hypothetical protein